MSPKAVTVRLVRTAQLRRLCLTLRPAAKPMASTQPKQPRAAARKK
jgi:hypothetical protein